MLLCFAGVQSCLPFASRDRALFTVFVVCSCRETRRTVVSNALTCFLHVRMPIVLFSTHCHVVTRPTVFITSESSASVSRPTFVAERLYTRRDRYFFTFETMSVGSKVFSM